MSPFRKPVQVIRRPKGRYERGIWINDWDEPAPETVMLGIQPASLVDYQRMEALPAGRRFAAMLRAYSDVTEVPLVPAGDTDQELPGDLVLYDGHRWLVIGRHSRTRTGRPGVSHIKYLLARQIESQFAEVTV